MGAAVIVVGALLALKFLHRSYRYRLTINVERNGVVHSGSSVIELDTVSTGPLGGLDNVPAWETHPRGEAVFVDLGDGMNLIALLYYDSAGSLQQTSVLPSRVILGDEVTRRLGIRFDDLSTLFRGELAETTGKTFPVAPAQLPPLIRFRDVNDPITVERVDPADLAGAYGADLAFRGATLEITNDAVTKGISRRLPWLSALKPDKALNGGTGTIFRRGDIPFSTAGNISYSNLCMD